MDAMRFILLWLALVAGSLADKSDYTVMKNVVRVHTNCDRYDMGKRIENKCSMPGLVVSNESLLCLQRL